MASLSSSPRLGNSSASSLIRSSSSLQNEISAYNDSLAAYQYELSPKTSEDFATYQNYLTGRITNLQTTGSVTDAQKALTLTRTLTSAVHSNVSADIQRENINIMSGNASLTDKYSTIVGQYQRAMGIGDLALAQTLESQAYSVSQSIQYQAQQSAAAATTLANANASGQGGVVKSLNDALDKLNNDVKHLGVKDLNKISSAWVDTNRDQLQQMGVIIPKGAQPNYFNLVEGIQAAKYNAYTLQAQAYAGSNPGAADTAMRNANNIQTGVDKIPTLGGSLTLQELQQAAKDPAMFAYDNSSGTYKKTTQTGYQYLDGQLAPTYSGYVSSAQANQIFFLNPNQTANLTSLGLNFTMNVNGKSVSNTSVPGQSGTTGDGVQVQLTSNSPQWLRNLLGENGVTRAFTDKSGNLQFEGPSTFGQGQSYYTLMTVGGLNGIFEHLPDGSTKLAGGNYGFDSGAASLLINYGQQQQYQIIAQTKAEQAAQAAKLSMAVPPTLPQIQAPPSTAPAANPTAPLQRTISTQSIQPTYNPQGNTFNPQQGAGQIHSNVQGVPLSQPKLNGIKL